MRPCERSKMQQLPEELQHKVLTSSSDCTGVLSYCSTHKKNACDWPQLMKDWYHDRAPPPGYDFDAADAATARANFQRQCRRDTLASFMPRVWHTLAQILFDPKIQNEWFELWIRERLDKTILRLELDENQRGVVTKAVAEFRQVGIFNHPFIDILRVMDENINRGEPNFVLASIVRSATFLLAKHLGMSRAWPTVSEDEMRVVRNMEFGAFRDLFFPTADGRYRMSNGQLPNPDPVLNVNGM